MVSPHISRAIESARAIPLTQSSSTLFPSEPPVLPPMPPLVPAASCSDGPTPHSRRAAETPVTPAWPYLQNVQPISPSLSPPKLDLMVPPSCPDLSDLDSLDLLDIMPSTDDASLGDDFPEYLDANAIDAAIRALESPDLFDDNNNPLPSVDTMFDLLDVSKDA